MGGTLGVKYCSAILAVGVGFLAFASAARAEGPRHAAMIIDANSGRVLHDANADAARYPASLTKLMTLYLVFEALDQGRLDLDTRLTVSEAAASVAPSKLELAAGETIKLSDAIKALVTKSANDMAVAIAEKIAGNEHAFAELMTKRARQIGMRSTTFRNASGLPDPEQQTTARDMLTLALRIHDDFPDRARVFSLRAFTYQGKTYRTHNTLMSSFAGMDGMKTGYTRASGFNLVSTVHRDGKYVVGAVFGGATASSRNAHMRHILDRALDNATTEKTRVSKPQLIASVRPAARPQKDEARPQKDEARPQKDEARPQAAPAWPPAKVAAVAPVPKPAPRPTLKAIENPKPTVTAAITPQGTHSPVATPALAAPAQAPQQSISVTPPAAQTPAAEPAQIVSVSPPAARTPADNSSVSPVAAVSGETGPETVEQAPASMPTVEAVVQPVSLTPAPVAAASATPKLDFAALRRAIVGEASTQPAARDKSPETRPDTPGAQSVTAAPPASAPPRLGETIIAKAADSRAAQARAPSTLELQVTQLEPAVATPTNPVAAKPARQTITSVTAARQPSTLSAQAATIAQDIPPGATSAAPMQLNGPVGKTARVAAPALQPAIQIGAYASPEEAERQLAAVQSKATATLSGASPIARRIESGGRQLYAARFAGLDEAASAKACLELRQQAIDCFVIPSR